ncbi:glycosyltransferase family 4 protein [candidate division KSB1 bacterium]|nr:glycosyltransferase family 4 protein [candidate division KSB1 bacterium]
MPDIAPTICYITAGAANMYCGSCMRDNTLVAALQEMGCNIHLFPTYTPILTDEEDVSENKIMLGGLNLYLQQKFGFFRRLPASFDRWLNNPRLIKILASSNLPTSGHETGAMVLSLLKGESGKQRKEFINMLLWLKEHVKPDLINLTNILIAGCLPLIKKHLNIPVLVTLQGDDLFLEQMIEPYKNQAIKRIQELVKQVDGFIVFSQYYKDFMSDYLTIPKHKIHTVQMGISLAGLNSKRMASNSGSPTIGYFARIAPEKGLHVLVDAFIRLRQMPGMQNVRLKAAGWLGRSHEPYLKDQLTKLKNHGLETDFEYAGVLDRREKIHFLQSLDLFSVPTTYKEPKGLYVLEALACGVPVVQPEHGAFPELIKATGGGQLVPPDSPEHLAQALHHLIISPSIRKELARHGQRRVFESMTAEAMAGDTLEIYKKYLGDVSQNGAGSQPNDQISVSELHELQSTKVQ